MEYLNAMSGREAAHTCWRRTAWQMCSRAGGVGGAAVQSVPVGGWPSQTLYGRPRVTIRNEVVSAGFRPEKAARWLALSLARGARRRRRRAGHGARNKRALFSLVRTPSE